MVVRGGIDEVAQDLLLDPFAGPPIPGDLALREVSKTHRGFFDLRSQRRSKLDLALFTDYGLSVDEEELLFATEREHLSSVGFGLVWNPLPGLHAEIYRGYALHDMGGPDESLQDRGIHYELTFRRAFF